MESMKTLNKDIFSLLRDSAKSGDFRLSCPAEKEEIHVHRLILSARSSVFQAVMDNDMIERNTGLLKIEDFKLDTVKSMVHYIYSGLIEESVKGDNLIALLKIGDKYQINGLVDDCVEKLVPTIDGSNVLVLGPLAEDLSAQTLLEECAKYVSRNREVLYNDDWKEKVKTSPLFLMHVVDYFKTIHVDISRFDSCKEDNESWQCNGTAVDAITIELNREATLVSIGFYGIGVACSNPVKISVKNKDSTILYSAETSFQSADNQTPVMVPVEAKLEAGIKYTILATINSGSVPTYYGAGGTSKVIHETGLIVMFFPAAESMNGTNDDIGQIPSLQFKY